jgi:6-phosphogluconate dehydrogenase
MALLRAASHEYGYNLRLGDIAAIWRGGCVIRARFLDRITEAYRRDPDLPNLLLDAAFGDEVKHRQTVLRTDVRQARDWASRAWRSQAPWPTTMPTGGMEKREHRIVMNSRNG